jgi:hypothetical protein
MAGMSRPRIVRRRPAALDYLKFRGCMDIRHSPRCALGKRRRRNAAEISGRVFSGHGQVAAGV